MSDTFHRRIQKLERESGKTVTTEVDLTSYQKDRENGTSEARYYVRHSNQDTVLEQELVISCDRLGRYEATAVFTDFPAQETPEAAALKLAAWMKRISEAIEANFQDNQGE